MEIDEEVSEERPHGLGITRKIFSLLFAGFASIIPIVGTVWLFSVIYRILLQVGESLINGIVGIFDWLRGIRLGDRGQRIDEYHELVAWSSSLPKDDHPVWFLIPILILALLGLAVTNRPGQAILNWIDHGITKVPFMGFVYSTLKQGVDSFRSLGGSRKFRGVAYVEYPSPGCRLFGFITGSYREADGKLLTSVFIPTSPNPLTGFVVIVDEERVIPSDLTVEEATKMLISAGLVAPERPFTKRMSVEKSD